MNIEIIDYSDVANTWDTPETYFKIGEKEIPYSENVRRPKRSFFSSRYGLDIFGEMEERL